MQLTIPLSVVVGVDSHTKCRLGISRAEWLCIPYKSLAPLACPKKVEIDVRANKHDHCGAQRRFHFLPTYIVVSMPPINPMGTAMMYPVTLSMSPPR